MKNVIYVFALLMITFCSCSKNEYTSVVTQFVELNNAMGVPKETVGVLIANVKETINRGESAYKTFFTAVGTQCAGAESKISSFIKGLKNQAADAQSNINSWNKNLAAAKKDLSESTSNINTGRAQLKLNRNRINKVILDFKVYAAEADKKLNVVKVLRDIISDELLNRSPALVQLNKFHAKLAELKELLNNKSDSLYAPMISVLLDLATEQNFSDQSVLRKILQNLNNLRTSLLNFRAQQEVSFNKDLKGLRQEARIIKSRIAAYRRMRNQAQSKAIDAGHYIAFYTHEIAHFNAEASRLGDELVLFKKLCNFERKVHKTGVQAYSHFRNTIVPYLFSSVQRIN
jgi:hypothetical protein